MNPAIAISKIKTACLAVLGRAPRPAPNAGDWVGSMKGQIQIVGDIVGPVVAPREWEALRDDAPDESP